MSNLSGVKFWQGGAVSSRNIGPAAGEHLLGEVREPGLYFWVGHNTDGKSHHLALLRKLQRERLLRNDSDITDGEFSAELRFALASVTFRRLPTGEVMEPERAGVDTLPRIEDIPTPIEALVTGLGRKGRDERARARLEALLTYAPVASSPELLEELCCGLVGSAVDAELGEERRAVYGLLTGIAQDRSKRLRVEPLRTRAEILAHLLALPRESVLEDFDALQDLLNATANSVEKAAAIQAERVAAAGGRIDEAAAGTAVRLSRQADAGLMAELMGAAVRSRPGEVEDLRVALAEKRSGNRARREEEARRAELRETLGERPSVMPQTRRLEEARDAREAAERARDAALAELRGEEEALVVPATLIEDRRRRIGRLYSAAVESFARVRDNYLMPESSGDLVVIPDDPRRAAQLAAEAAATLDALREATFDVSGCMDDHARRLSIVLRMRSAVEELGAAARIAKNAALAREAELDEALGAIEKWEHLAAQLAAPLGGATDEEVAAAEAELARAERARVLDEGGAAVRAAAALHAREDEARLWLLRVADDLRRAAKSAWTVLGRAVAAELALPWLRVEEGRILLAYDGRGSRARLASSDAEAVDVRDLDDAERVSSAELHEAVLRVMLARREKLGGILIIPDRTLYPLDEDRLRRFSGWARDAGIWAFSERPRRSGDPEDLALQYVEPLGEAAADSVLAEAIEEEVGEEDSCLCPECDEEASAGHAGSDLHGFCHACELAGCDEVVARCLEDGEALP